MGGRMEQPPKIILSATLDLSNGRVEFVFPQSEVMAAGLLTLLTERLRIEKILPAVMPRVTIPMPAGRG
jgi:hypothetical protein